MPRVHAFALILLLSLAVTISQVRPCSGSDLGSGSGSGDSNSDSDAETESDSVSSCGEQITVPQCMSNEQDGFVAMFTTTVLPNRYGHKTQQEVAEALKEHQALLDTKCSKYLRQFICIDYLPPCEYLDEEPDYREIFLPCREFCDLARDECEPVLRKLNKRKHRRRHQLRNLDVLDEETTLEVRHKMEAREARRKLKWPKAFKCRRNYNSIMASGLCVLPEGYWDE